MDSSSLRCPDCGGECLHPEGVYVVTKGDDYTPLHAVFIAVGDRSVKPTFGIAHVDGEMVTRIAGSNRGTVIARVYSCETCPAQPIYVDRFHKGSTYVEVVA